MYKKWMTHAKDRAVSLGPLVQISKSAEESPFSAHHFYAQTIFSSEKPICGWDKDNYVIEWVKYSRGVYYFFF